jgi:hypothetical protein
VFGGDVRRVAVHFDGWKLAEFPMTVGLVGVHEPVLQAIRAITDALEGCTLRVEFADREAARVARMLTRPHQPPQQNGTGLDPGMRNL